MGRLGDGDVGEHVGVGDGLVVGGGVGVIVAVRDGGGEHVHMRAGEVTGRDGEGGVEGSGSSIRQNSSNLAVTIASQRAKLVVGQNGDRGGRKSVGGGK